MEGPSPPAMSPAAALAALFLLLPPAALGGPVVTTVPIAPVDQATFLTQAPGDLSRLFVTGRTGRIRIIKDGVLLAEPFLDITALVDSSVDEYGLVCLAFHPGYQGNGQFFVTYSSFNSTGVLARGEVSADADRADPGSLGTVLAVAEPNPDHSVAWIAFGPDGYLYVGSGDGGVLTQGHAAQNTDSLLGKLLRIDVNAPFPYGIPAGNPFVGQHGLDEIWARGLRNPWRCSFDRLTGHLWIADVGGAAREEVNVQPAGAGGANYGWNCMEATICHAPATGCTCGGPGLAAPVYEYDHTVGCAIIGGHVYRGAAIPQLQGRYIFGDLCAGKAWAYDPGAGTASEILADLPFLWSFGEDLAGELYVLSNGWVSKIVFTDCNANSIPDVQDIAEGTSLDCNQNNVPDECDVLGDLDGDGLVGVPDLLSLLASWGPCPAPPQACPADLSGDGTVGVIDMLILLASWS